MVEVCPEPRHARQGIPDCSRQRQFSGDAGQLCLQPGFQFIEDELCPRLPALDRQVWWRAARFFLDRVELRDTPDDLVRDG